jgi:hypothetical protein
MAKIEYLCDRTHDVEQRNAGGPTITLIECKWAYCGAGGRGGHDWWGIFPTTVEQLEQPPELFRSVWPRGDGVQRRLRVAGYDGQPDCDLVRLDSSNTNWTVTVNDRR